MPIEILIVLIIGLIIVWSTRNSDKETIYFKRYRKGLFKTEIEYKEVEVTYSERRESVLHELADGWAEIDLFEYSNRDKRRFK